jgi:hypothetical protein
MQIHLYSGQTLILLSIHIIKFTLSIYTCLNFFAFNESFNLVIGGFLIRKLCSKEKNFWYSTSSFVPCLA